MDYKKSIISFLLLFTYSIGFAHNVVAHSNAAHDIQHDHGVHHQGDEHGDEHIEHGDHVDLGIYDLIFCLFVEVEHSDHKHVDDNFEIIKINTQRVDIYKSSFMVALFSLFHFQELEGEEQSFYAEFHHFYESVSPGDILHRGPPVFS